MYDQGTDVISRAVQQYETTSAWQVPVFRPRIRSLFVMHLFAACFFLWLTINPDYWQPGAAWMAYMMLCWGIAAAWNLKTNNPEQRPNRSLRTMLAFAFILSSPWLLAVELLIPVNPSVRLAVASVLALLAGGVTHSMGPWFAAAAISLSCILLPSALLLIMEGNQFERPLGYCQLGLFYLYLKMCFRSSRLLRENSQLRLVSGRMVEQLQDQVHTQIHARERVEHALQLAEQACLDKSRFLAAASHDLRQPMHAICLFLAALKSEAFENRSRYLLDRLDRRR